MEITSTDLLALRIRNAIADKEWLTAAANHDVAKFGQWQCDWQEGIRDVNRELHELWEESNASGHGRGIPRTVDPVVGCGMETDVESEGN
jgi:hypothetical protein